MTLEHSEQKRGELFLAVFDKSRVIPEKIGFFRKPRDMLVKISLDRDPIRTSRKGIEGGSASRRVELVCKPLSLQLCQTFVLLCEYLLQIERILPPSPYLVRLGCFGGNFVGLIEHGDDTNTVMPYSRDFRGR